MSSTQSRLEACPLRGPLCRQPGNCSRAPRGTFSCPSMRPGLRNGPQTHCHQWRMVLTPPSDGKGSPLDTAGHLLPGPNRGPVCTEGGPAWQWAGGELSTGTVGHALEPRLLSSSPALEHPGHGLAHLCHWEGHRTRDTGHGTQESASRMLPGDSRCRAVWGRPPCPPHAGRAAGCLSGMPLLVRRDSAGPVHCLVAQTEMSHGAVRQEQSMK